MKKILVISFLLGLILVSPSQAGMVIGSGAATGGTPTLVSATVTTAGTTINVVWSQACSRGVGYSLPPTVSLTYASGDGTTSWVFNTDRVIFSGQSLTISYTQPGNGIEATTGGADVATFSGSAVTNSSTTTYLAYENFDGANECTAGYTSNCLLPADSWVVASGTPDYHNTTYLLNGTYSAYFAGATAAQAYTAYTASGEVYGFFLYDMPAGGFGAANFFSLRSTSTNKLLVTLDATGHLKVQNGTATASSFTTNGMSPSTHYCIFFRYKTGVSNGIGQIGFNAATTCTEPAYDGASGVAVSNGNGNSTVDRLYITGSNSFNPSAYDEIKLSTVH